MYSTGFWVLVASFVEIHHFCKHCSCPLQDECCGWVKGIVCIGLRSGEVKEKVLV